MSSWKRLGVYAKFSWFSNYWRSKHRAFSRRGLRKWKYPRITNLSMNFFLRLINKPSFRSQPAQAGYWAWSAEGKRTLESENAEHLSHKLCSDQSYLRLCSYLSILTSWIFGVVYWSLCISFPDFSDWDVVLACVLESCKKYTESSYIDCPDHVSSTP